MALSHDITDLLNSLRSGEQQAVHKLLPLVYRELHGLAERALRGQRPDHTLQATALVHEAYLRLLGHTHADWRDRAHFFAVAAKAMRSILIDYARARQTKKRARIGERKPIVTIMSPEGAPAVDLIALDEALDHLEEEHSRSSRVVELRFFAGLTREETAEVLEVSVGTVERDWRYAQGWLLREMNRDPRQT